jgi:putative transposase
VHRDFTASGPDRLWVGDITYLRCWEGIVFFAFVLDAHSRRIVGWQFASHMRTELVLDALQMAIYQRRPAAVDVELIAHTDRGSQYTSQAYTDALADGLTPAASTARSATCRQPSSKHYTQHGSRP